MSEDAHGVAASVAEVAAFAWSLIELLFIRILPLLGFLVGQLVLHTGRLALEVVSPSSPSPSTPRPRRPRRPQGWSSWLSEQQQQAWPTYEAADLATPTYHNSAAAAGRWADSYLTDYDSPPADHVEMPEKAEALPAPQADIAAELERSEQQEPSVATEGRAAVSEQAGPSGTQIAIADPQPEQPRPSSPQSEISQSESPVNDSLALVPNPMEAPVSNRQQEESAMPAAAGADSSAEAVRSTPSDRRSIDDSLEKGGPSQQESEPSKPVSESTVEGATQQRVDSVDKVELKDETPGSADRQPLTRRKSPSQKKRHPFANVLPPSLSQIKHTLMQKSRRASPSWLH